MREIIEMQFKNSPERFIALAKLRIKDLSTKVLARGWGRTRCRGFYVWALVEKECEKISSSKECDTKYFPTEEDRQQFISELELREHKIIRQYETNGLKSKNYAKHVWCLTFQCN